MQYTGQTLDHQILSAQDQFLTLSRQVLDYVWNFSGTSRIAKAATYLSSSIALKIPAVCGFIFLCHSHDRGASSNGGLGTVCHTKDFLVRYPVTYKLIPPLYGRVEKQEILVCLYKTASLVHLAGCLTDVNSKSIAMNLDLMLEKVSP